MRIRIESWVWAGLVRRSLAEVFQVPEGDTRADPEYARGITYLCWLRNTLGSLRRSWRLLPWWIMSGFLNSAWSYHYPVLDKWQKMDAWIYLFCLFPGMNMHNSNSLHQACTYSLIFFFIMAEVHTHLHIHLYMVCHPKIKSNATCITQQHWNCQLVQH